MYYSFSYNNIIYIAAISNNVLLGVSRVYEILYISYTYNIMLGNLSLEVIIWSSRKSYFMSPYGTTKKIDFKSNCVSNIY